MSRTVTNGSSSDETDAPTRWPEGAEVEPESPGFLEEDEALSEHQLAGLYGLNLALLNVALVMRGSGPALSAAAAAQVAGIGYMLDSGRRRDPVAVARHNAELFACIAGLARDPRVADLVHSINDRLHDIRTLEAEQLDEVSAELTSMCELLLVERYGELASAIANYHDRRLSALSSQAYPIG